MKCDDCIHKSVCYRTDSVSPSYADKCGDFGSEKTGHWVLTDDDLVYCSECEDSYYARPIDASWYYCPHCGAKMESEV